jgi:hypothetical protein
LHMSCPPFGAALLIGLLPQYLLMQLHYRNKRICDDIVKKRIPS